MALAFSKMAPVLARERGYGRLTLTGVTEVRDADGGKMEEGYD